MDRHAVVAKTDKGEEEIRHRCHMLERNLRYILILVDGSSNVDEVIAKGAGFENVEAGLQQLEELGFIELRGGVAANEEGGANLSEAKMALIAIAREILGPDAGKVVAKLEAAPDDIEGLRAAANSCKKLVRLIISESKAEEMNLRCQSILDSL